LGIRQAGPDTPVHFQHRQQLWYLSPQQGELCGKWEPVGATDSILGYVWNYTYDDFNRLATTSQVNGSTTVKGFNYLYDRYGNRWQQNLTAGTGPNPTYTFNANNQITFTANCTPTVGTYCYDAAGNLTSDSFHVYKYDAEGRIANVDNGTTTYVYDATGHRAMTSTAGNNLYDGYDLAGRLVWQFQGSSWARGEVYGAKGRVATYKAGYTFFPSQDLVGTVRNNSTQDTTYMESCVSLPFGDGEGCFGNASGLPGPAFFTGKDRDTESNLDYFGARYYSSTQGRFLSPDWADAPTAVPYAHFGNPQSLNLYAYVENNPTTVGDPDGHDPIPPGPEGSLDSNGQATDKKPDPAQKEDPTAPPPPPTPGLPKNVPVVNAPGTQYKTVRAAAKTKIRGTNPQSVRENKEIAGRVVRNANGTFGTTQGPESGRQLSSADPGSVPAGTVNAGIWHDHGGPDPRFDNEHFSDVGGDKDLSRSEGVPIYVGTPGGTIREFDPATGSDIQIGTTPH
jgi:RHS repeat-associated protein